MASKSFDVPDIGTITVYKRRGTRSLRLSLTPEGAVRVTIPFWAPYQAGVRFAESRRAWIAAHPRPDDVLLHSGFPVGKTRRLVFAPTHGTTAVKTNVRKQEVVVSHPAGLAIESRTVQTAARNACYRAIKQEATALLTPRINQLANGHGFAYRSLKIKRMKTRWGSCDQHTNIVLNLYLMQLPWHLIDYVIVHELIHTRVLNHGADFWAAFEEIMPDARALRRAMRAHQPRLAGNAES